MEYKVGQGCFLNGKWHDAGTTVPWSGKRGKYMTPVEGSAEPPVEAPKPRSKAKKEPAEQPVE